MYISIAKRKASKYRTSKNDASKEGSKNERPYFNNKTIPTKAKGKIVSIIAKKYILRNTNQVSLNTKAAQFQLKKNLLSDLALNLYK